jgi:molybdopterin converting factor small subunit
MTVHVEFFGIPRRRAGMAATYVDAGTLGEVLDQLAARLPRFAESCLDGGRLKGGYTASINGRIFTTSRETALAPGDAVLILSADAGG